jgi:deazaflavin-dependent oxidoreductase (nitroreductase family)
MTPNAAVDQLHGAEHVRRYLETDGAEGHEWRGAETLLLTSKGRKSGEERTTPLIYREQEGVYTIVASNGGFRTPGWYRNLQADPEVTVQIFGEVFRARARDATPDEKPRFWATMTEVWPAYDEYQERAEREIPVVVLERV